MTVALFASWVRIAIAGAAVALLILGWLLARFGRRTLASLALVIASGGLGVLAAEGLVALTVELTAPRSTDFNEFRWVLLAPWGRVGLYLGVGAVAAIAALSWWSTRRAGPWRGAGFIEFRMAASSLALVVCLQPAIELRQVAREPNRIAVLVDDSRSMTLRESVDGPDRQERVRDLVAASADTFATWEQEHLIDFYTFS